MLKQKAKPSPSQSSPQKDSMQTILSHGWFMTLFEPHVPWIQRGIKSDNSSCWKSVSQEQAQCSEQAQQYQTVGGIIQEVV